MSESTVKDYIMAKFCVQECVTERISPRHKDTATFSSFKVGVDSSKGEAFLSPVNWPKGTAVSRWHFFPRRQTSQGAP